MTPSTEPPSPTQQWAADLAQHLIKTGEKPPADLDDTQRLALAWALKDAAIAAWSSAPSEVVVASETLSALLLTVATARASKSVVEVGAIYQWVNGIAEITRGNMTDAIRHLDDSTRGFRSCGHVGHAAHAQVPKIMALSMMGRHAEAITSGAETLSELAATGELLAAGKISLNLGNLHCRISNFYKALQNYKHASTLFASVGDPQWSVMSEIGEADALSLLGQFDDAVDMYAHARTRARQNGMHVLDAMAQESTALIQLARGQYGAAFAGLVNASEQYALLNMPQHLATTHKQLGDAYLDVRLLPEALALFEAAVERFGSLEMFVEQAWALTQRGRSLAGLHRPSSEINASLNQAWDLFVMAGVSAGRATVLLVRAELEMAHHNTHAATNLAEDAANAFAAAALPLGHAQANVVRAHAFLENNELDLAEELFAATQVRARELLLLSIELHCQVGLGLVAIARGELVVGAAAFESAIASAEEQRSALQGDDIRNAFLLDQLRPHEELLRIAVDAFDPTPTNYSAKRVLVQLERLRARVLGERLGDPRSRPPAAQSIDPDFDLRARLSWLYRRRQKLVDEGEDTQSLTVEIRRIENDLLEHARRRRFTSDSDPTSVDAGAFDPATLQAALSDGEVLIEYGVIDDELFTCVVTRERVALQRRMASWSEVKEAIVNARFQIDSVRVGAGVVDRHMPLLTRRAQAAMRRVHELIWAPLRTHLGGCTKAVIVPHDQLGSLQFAALYDGENYLAQRMSIALAPSARVALHGLSRPPVPARRALVLGESSRLMHAGEEAHFVAGLFDEASVLVGESAAAASLRAAGAEADVLHLACHAEFRSDNPMFSALHLADGPFNVQDAETLQLRQGVVVLSACETGIAAYSRGDEMIGLVRAFLLAGSSRVVASLWPVDDAVTLKFMAAFYRSLRGGSAPSAALRAAQLEVMQSYPHPFHWAAFTLYGGW